jgi:hypothetical protein
MTNEDQEEEISGNTLRVYWYILKKRENCGVREVQRALGFSSSSSAHYHLEKLADKGFLIKDKYGNYQVDTKVKTGSISPFILIHGFIFPRQLFYAIATAAMNVFFLTVFWRFLTLIVLLALTPGILACIIFWYETVTLWLSLPSFEESVR